MDDGPAVVMYEVRWTDGTGTRNAEVLTVRDGKVTTVEVYFGWTTPHGVPPGAHRDAGNATPNHPTIAGRRAGRCRRRDLRRRTPLGTTRNERSTPLWLGRLNGYGSA